MTDSKAESQTEEHITMNRDGKLPLTFVGRLIAESTSHANEGPRQNRWDNYELYRTRAGRYVLYHEYTTLWQGESSRYEAWIGADPRALILGAAYDGILSSVLVELAERAGIDIAEQID